MNIVVPKRRARAQILPGFGNCPYNNIKEQTMCQGIFKLWYDNEMTIIIDKILWNWILTVWTNKHWERFNITLEKVLPCCIQQVHGEL